MSANPAWTLRLELANGAKLLGRLPAGRAATADAAIQLYLQLNTTFANVLTAAERACVTAVARGRAA